MATTKIELINAALTVLGQEPITSVTDPDNETARKVNRIYDTVRRAVLRKHFWNFAMKEVELSLLTTVPVLDDFTTVFQLPTDFIRLKKTSLGDDDAYKIKGKTIYCNADTLMIEYVYDCTDPNAFDSTFIEAFAAALAGTLGYSITTNATLAKNVQDGARDALQNAKSIDSQEETPDKPRSGSWIRARRG